MGSWILFAETLLYLCGLFLIFNKINIRTKKHIVIMSLNISIRAILLILSVFIVDIVAIGLILVTLLDIFTLKKSFKDIKIKTIFIVYLMFYAIYILFSSVATFLINDYLQTSALVYVGTLCGAIIMLLCIIITTVKPSVITNILIVPSSAKRICGISILSSSLLMYLLLYINGFLNTTEWNLTPKILIVIFIIIIGSLFPALIANSIGKVFYNNRAKSFEAQLELQARHYEEIAENNFELRRFKHDYKNMIIGVRELIQHGDADKALNLLQNGNEAISENIFHEFDTGNGIVDAILTEKQKAAKNINTTVNFQGFIPTKRLSATEWCVIFGNTLDNALEACERQDISHTHNIDISCRSSGGFIFITIKNPVSENIDIINNSIRSTKSNTAEHGFGIYSLKEIISKYNGNLNLSCIDKTFTVDLEIDVT